VSPALFLMKLERVIIDSLTTVISTLRGSAMRGGLSTGIFALLQQSSWAESFSWYAPSGVDDPLQAHDLEAQFAGSSYLFPPISVGGLDVWAGLAADSRRLDSRHSIFTVAEVIPTKVGMVVRVVGLNRAAKKTVLSDPVSGRFYTHRIDQEVYPSSVPDMAYQARIEDPELISQLVKP